MKLNIDQIIVDERIRNGVGNIEELALDLRVNGQIVPITVRVSDKGEYHLVAGYRRLKAMKMNGEEEIEAYVIPDDDEELLLRMEISENEIREGFTRTERMNYIRRLDELEAKKAKQRMSDGGKGTQNSADVGESRDKVAEQVGISHDTIAREKKIIEHKDEIDPEDFKNWDEGKLSTNKVFTELKAKLKAKEQEVNDLIGSNDKLVQRTEDLERKAMKFQQMYESKELPQETIEEIAELKEENTKLWNETKDLKAETAMWKTRFNESNISSQEDAAASHDMDILTKAITSFLNTYGGRAWAIDRRESIAEHHTEELRKQVKNLYAFALNLYEMTKGENE